MIARVVIVPAAGDTAALDYKIGDDLVATIQPGSRVVVPLGSRRVTGVVVEIVATSDFPRLKTVVACLDQKPLFDASMLRLCNWIADYYLSDMSEALSTALPGTLRVRIDRVVQVTDTTGDETKLNAAQAAVMAWLRQSGPVPLRAVAKQFGRTTQGILSALRRRSLVALHDRIDPGTARTKRQRLYRSARTLSDDEITKWRRRPAQFALYTYLHNHPLGVASANELAISFKSASGLLNTLQKAGLVAMHEEEIYRTVFTERAAVDRRVALNPDQQAAVSAVHKHIGESFRTFLLWGVTGSGKTEVYLHCIAQALATGHSALVLVPEISLTHQVVDRIRARFGERVAVLHSGLSDGERWDEWRRIARGEAPIVVGARSAVFAPLPKLGVILVDEEHDSAYKQEDGIRYQGRDVAVMRGKLVGCPVVLGSATPSMETYFNARSARYELLTLPQRVASRPLPSVDIIDLRARGASIKQAPLVSRPLQAALTANLAAGGQSLVFLNRRGFSNFLQCYQCGEPLRCPNCTVSLTLHQKWQALRCHHCDHTIAIPKACPSCGGLALGAWGAGTEQVEAALHALLPQARIARMDRDTTSRKGEMQRIFTAWQKRDFDVLIGTQMITKGHDIPGVTLVGVLLADLSLNMPDLRAAERTFQLLTQVAGRAGRGDQPGRVIVQTREPDHYSLRFAQHHDFRSFAERELRERREANYPPFTRLIQIRCEGEDAAQTESIAIGLAESLRAHGKAITVLGPAKAPIEKVRRRFRWQILVRSTSPTAARTAVRAACDALRQQTRKAQVRVLIDVDPNSMM